ncbi:MAG TPA: hypothetical protein VHW00_20415 [Thermoanaerobaculia bacterium]|nr:hypothetical protein [Thermoanaerobaculia bacterium]
MRKCLLLLSVLLTLPMLALGNADVAITSFTADAAQVQPGGTVTFTIVLRNLGSETAQNLNFNLGNAYSERMHVVSTNVLPSWTCSPLLPGCFAPSLAPNTEAPLTLQVAIAPTTRTGTYNVSFFGSATNESSTANNRADLSLTIVPAPRTADLSVTLRTPQNPVSEGSSATLTYDVRNNGPQDLSDVRLMVYLVGIAGEPSFTQGWDCTKHTATTATCTRPSLSAGAIVPFELSFDAPSSRGELVTLVSAYALQPHLDPNLANDEAWHTVFVGNSSDWSRILVPLTSTDIAGANGSLWKTEITGLITDPNGGEIVPYGCGPIEDPCSPPPAGVMFDVHQEDLLYESLESQFIYVPHTAPQMLQLSTRVYDASKAQNTAGAFVPTARDEDFSPHGFTLIGVPWSPEFRSMLRIYEYDGTNGDRVLVEIYAADGSVPFYRAFHTLTASATKVTTALLPAQPGYAQVDLSSILDGSNQGSRFRISVTPGSGRKLWGFVSITNNQTSHVTVIAP